MEILNRDQLNYLNQSQNSDSEQWYNTILRVTQLCCTKREEMYEMCKGLRKDQKIATKIDQKYKTGNIFWTEVKCLALAGGAMACFVPGVGWVVGGIILGANVGAIYGGYRNDKKNQEAVNQLIGEIKSKSENITNFSELVNQKKEVFDRDRIQLISQGMDETHASIFLIIQILERLFSNQQEASSGDNQGNDRGKFFSKIFGLAFGGIEITPVLLQKVIVAAAVTGIAWDVYTCAEKCLKESEAVEKIEEIMDVLEDGQHSMQFFENLLNYIREGMLRQQMFGNKAEIDGRLEELELASDNRITALLNEHNMIVDQQLDQINNRFEELSLRSDNEFHSFNSRLIEQNLNFEQMNNTIQSLQTIVPNMSFQMNNLQNEMEHLKKEVNLVQSIGVLREEIRESHQELNRRILEQNQFQCQQNQIVIQAIVGLTHLRAVEIDGQTEQEENESPRAISGTQQNVSD